MGATTTTSGWRRWLIGIVTVALLAGVPTSPASAETDPDTDAHVHDLWDGRDQVTILDETVIIDWYGEVQDDPAVLLRPVWDLDLRPATVDGELVPNTVFPGTARIEMELEWVGGNGVIRLCFANQGARGNLCSQGFGRTLSSGGGSEATWTVDGDFANGHVLNEDTWDDPHSLKSNWRWQVWPCMATMVNQCPADTTLAGFRLTVTIHRMEGDLPLDPPHPDLWGDETELTMIDETTLSSAPLQLNWVGQAHQQVQGESRPYWYINGFRLVIDPDLSGEVPVVANGTRDVVVDLHVRSLNGGHTPLTLKYRSAADPWSDPWRETDLACLGQCTYVLPVGEGEDDSPYAHQTQWEFGIFPAAAPSAPLADYEVGLGITIRR